MRSLEDPGGPWRTRNSGLEGSQRVENCRKCRKCRIWRDLGSRPENPENGSKIPENTGKLVLMHKKKCEIFPNFHENRQKTAFFRGFYGAPRPRKWEKYLRTPRSLGGHLYTPAPKQWSIGAPPDFRVISPIFG